MLTLPLEPTDDRANPLFKDAAGCTKWLGQLQLTNLQLAHSLLFTQVNELNRYPMRGLERLNTMELLRETIGYVQDDYAKKLIAKPLPLNFLRILFDSSATFTPFPPVRKRIAKSSEFVSFPGPYFWSFSRGRSIFGRSLIRIIMNMRNTMSLISQAKK